MKRELFEQLQTRPRRLGLTNQLRFIAEGPGSIAILVFLFGVAIMGWIGTLEFFAVRIMMINAESVPGQVVYVDETSMSVNEEYVYKTGFRYQVDGSVYNSFSYDVGGRYDTGAEVTVVYSRFNPAISKVKGLDYSFLGWFHLIPAFIFLIAFLQVIWGMSRWLLWGRLLVQGKAAEAVLTSQKESGLRINDVPVVEYIFTYQDDDGDDHQHKVSTHLPEKITDEDSEIVLYDPNRPEKAFLMDEMPFGVSLAEPGRWAASPRGIPYISLFLLVLSGFLASLALARLFNGLFG